MTTFAMAIRTIPVPSRVESPVGDTVTLVVWAVLACLSLRLVWRLPASVRGAWYVVAIYCTVVAVDKFVDLQTAFYQTVRWSTEVLDPWLGLRQHRLFVRVLLLVPATIVAVGGTVALVRRDRNIDRAKKLAIGGLVLVLVFVAGRLLPGLRWLFSEAVCWGLEAVACLLIAAGLRLGFHNVRCQAQK